MAQSETTLLAIGSHFAAFVVGLVCRRRLFVRHHGPAPQRPGDDRVWRLFDLLDDDVGRFASGRHSCSCLCGSISRLVASLRTASRSSLEQSDC